MKPEDFKPGERVTYVPYHAKGNLKHMDCERGFVSNTNEKFVFVRFQRSYGEACYPDQLVKGW